PAPGHADRRRARARVGAARGVLGRRGLPARDSLGPDRGTRLGVLRAPRAALVLPAAPAADSLSMARPAFLLAGNEKFLEGKSNPLPARLARAHAGRLLARERQA